MMLMLSDWVTQIWACPTPLMATAPRALRSCSAISLPLPEIARDRELAWPRS